MSKMSLLTIAEMSEEEARAYFERVRWAADHPCPICGTVDESYRLNGKAHRAGVWKCKACGQQHTVTVGTVMHGSRLGLRKWLMAFFLYASSKKSVSALQLQRQLGIGSYKTAWHLGHRVRWAMRNGPLSGKIGGPGSVVEVDEMYHGGRERFRHRKKRGLKKKVPVWTSYSRSTRASSPSPHARRFGQIGTGCSATSASTSRGVVSGHGSWAYGTSVPSRKSADSRPQAISGCRPPTSSTRRAWDSRS